MKACKKPIVVDVEQFTADNYETICNFISLPWGPDGVHCVENDLGIEADTGEKLALVIPTLEGDMLALDDDYIIKGVNGEFYPCKPDIFEKTYDIEFETTINDYHKKMGYTELNI